MKIVIRYVLKKVFAKTYVLQKHSFWPLEFENFNLHDNTQILWRKSLLVIVKRFQLYLMCLTIHTQLVIQNISDTKRSVKPQN